LFPLEEAFQAMSKKDLDLWGMTQNQEIQPHLQSYFLVFNKRAFTSPEFQNFWKNFRYYRSKRRLIQLYELGFSRLAKNYGWKVDSFIAANIGSGIQVDSNGQELNPTLYHWDTLIEKFRFPFLKTEVLRLNRTQSPRIHDWKQILSNHTNYKPELIQSHLTSVKN
jgi:lipopolysaccharide biosynthesis protein